MFAEIRIVVRTYGAPRPDQDLLLKPLNLERMDDSFQLLGSMHIFVSVHITTIRMYVSAPQSEIRRDYTKFVPMAAFEYVAKTKFIRSIF